MKFAYADPPYIGQAKRYPEKTEVDHDALIKKLVTYYPDGWALSLSSPSLKCILSLCPVGIRVGAWVKPFASFKPNVNPAYTWEPVIFSGGRKRGREVPTLRDFVSANITLKKGLAGAKPPEFLFWVLDWLNFQEGDTMDDLYPGTFSMSRAIFVRRIERTLAGLP